MSASCSSSNYHTSRPSARCISYDVFLNFRGADTRLGFTDHLYTALVNAGFGTFRDDDELERGETIDPGLYKAIHDSRCSIIVLSKDYASSESCLYELVTILEYKRTSDHIVLPVFYHVDRDEVWHQSGCYKEAFAGHEAKFKDDIGKVDQWRAALREASELARMNLKDQADRHEAKFIKQIVKEVEDKLRRTPLSVTSHLIGIDLHLEKINLWLNGGSTTGGVLFICGIPGIGKTTIAKSVYNSNYNRIGFEGHAFLENISSEILTQPRGLVVLQSKLLSILTNRDVVIHNVSEGTNRIRDTIRSKRVLLVLDDVDHVDILTALLGMRDWLCPRTKIIITTRQHVELLKAREVYKVHMVEPLDTDESLKLFSRHAFGQDKPIEQYEQLSERIAYHCGGLPLALQTLGRTSLSWKSIDYWKSAVEKLEDISNGEILSKLKLCYDTLEDDNVQNLFLDIACFFGGMDKNFIIAVLDGCGAHTTFGIENLIDRYLITIDENNLLRMHSLLRDLGREIVSKESPKAPGRRSRLWKAKDSLNVLTEKTGEETIEGIMLHKWTIPSMESKEVVLETNTFAKMSRLRLLILSDVQLQRSFESFSTRLISIFSSRGYESFPKGLRWLSWHAFSLHSIPGDFVFESLVALDMRFSNLRQVWDSSKSLPMLKILDLSHSHYLTRTPDFSLLPKLQTFMVCDCVSLVYVHESIGSLKELETLDISGCSNLTQFPLPEFRKMESLKVFNAKGTPISQWLKTIGEVKSLAIPWPRLLTEVSLAKCNLSNDDFPSDFSNLSSLRILDLSENQISCLPDCIKSLNGLDHLSFWYCEKLQSIEGLPRVNHLNVTFCNSLEKVTFQSASCRPVSVSFPFYRNLFEFESWFKLEPIGSVDVKMINIFGLHNLVDYLQNITINITSIAWGNSKSLPIQGIYEHGIFNIFLPLDEVRGCSRYRRRHNWRDSISFVLPIHSITKMLGLNLSIIYAVYDHLDSKSSHITIQVCNESKGLKWIYCPTFFGYADDVEDMLWLSHWKFGNQLEGGDRVTVSIFVHSSSTDKIEVKNLGVQVMYETNEYMGTEIDTQEYTENSDVEGTIDEIWPDKYQVMPGTYFIVGVPCTPEFTEKFWRIWENSVSDQKERMERFN